MASTVQINQRVVREGDGTQNIAGIVLIVLGVMLVIVGSVMLIYLGMTVFGILKSPDDTKLVTMILEQTQTRGQAFFGSFGDNKIEFTLGEPLRTLLFVLILLWILGVVLNIIKSIVSTGRDLVMAGRGR